MMKAGGKLRFRSQEIAVRRWGRRMANDNGVERIGLGDE